MSTSSTLHQNCPDLSLTLIYQAIQKPTSTANLKCRNQLHTATIKQLDYALRKLKSYTKQSQWPSRRLIRCLNYIFIHGIKTSAQIEDLVQLPSLKACVRWVFKITTASIDNNGIDEESTFLITGAAKFICALLETFASQRLSDSTATAGILTDIKLHHGAKTLLDWSQKPNHSIRIYTVRALTAQVHFFAKDLIALDVYAKLTHSLLEIPSLMNMLILKPAITDASQKRSELEQCIMTCRLIESIFKYEQPNQTSTSRISFAESKVFRQLVIVWQEVCHFEYNTLTGTHPPLKVKNEQLLSYSLTTVIQKGTSVYQKAASCVAEEESRSQWQPYLTLLMQRWILGTCCTMNVSVIPPATLNAEKSILKKMVQISLDMVPILQHHMFWVDYVDQLICDLTNFFMAFISQPILPEQAAMIGTASTLLHTNICIDVEERGFKVTGDLLNEHQDLVVLLFESFIQHVQLATPHFIKMISGRVAWCLKSLLTILLQYQLMETSGLRTRILKLIIFFLHYYDAIDILAASSTSITPYVWGPTIELAKNGLITATKLSPNAELQQQEVSIIYKAKRAFVALETISTHPRACERLMDCNVLQLVDISLIPSGDVMEKTTSLLTVYALFGRLIAALSRRTAFVRTRLRDECGLFPMIMKLLEEAIEHKESRDEKDSILQGWNQVISSCLLVVSSFQYDESSMRMWLSWDQATEKNEEASEMKEDSTESKMEEDSVMIKQEEQEYGVHDHVMIEKADIGKSKISVLPSVLSILFPWKKQDSKSLDISSYLKSEDNHSLIILAAQVLDQLSGIPVCGRQMLMDDTALHDLSSLMISLTTAAVCQEEEMFQNERSSSSMVICAEKNTSSVSGEEVVEEERGPLTVEDYMQVDQAEIDEEEDKATSATRGESLNYRCAGYLRRTAIRTLTCHDNIQFTILSDAFTTFFQPMLQHPSSGTSHEYWRRAICDDLYEKKFGDFMSLYKFTEMAGDHSIKLHEFTAVAVGYASIGTTIDEDWNLALGLTLLEGGIVSTKHIFGVFCQMLVYELEYEEEEEEKEVKEEKEQQQQTDSLLTLITPFRRNAAAQVIETLALELEVIWRVETESIRNTIFTPEYIPLISPQETVYFSTDDSSTFISGNRQLLRARSPIFEALLGSDYAEESNLVASKAIPLHDVTFHSLELFISVMHQLNNATAEEDILDNASRTTWTDIVDLLQISDRFGSQVVKSRCEHWVLNKVKHLQNMTKNERRNCLEGMLGLYRHCRDPIEQDGGITSDTWPFATLLHESLKAIVQYLSESCQTREFMEMVHDKNVEELDAFCDGIACLLKK